MGIPNKDINKLVIGGVAFVVLVMGLVISNKNGEIEKLNTELDDTTTKYVERSDRQENEIKELKQQVRDADPWFKLTEEEQAKIIAEQKKAEEKAKEQAKKLAEKKAEEERQAKLEQQNKNVPSDTLVYAKIYNGNKIYGGHVHRDRSCSFLEGLFSNDLPIIKTTVEQLRDGEYRCSFCPMCTEESLLKYDINGNPK